MSGIRFYEVLGYICLVMTANQIKKQENLKIYNMTIRQNYRELNSIDKKTRLSLLLFFAYFIDRYRSLMSELSHE